MNKNVYTQKPMIYLYKCMNCTEEYDEYFRMGQAVDTVCPKCGSIGKRVFTPAKFKIDIADPYFSHQTGNVVKNRAEEEHKLQQLDQVN